MWITVGRLRELCQEARIAAHPDYVRKERVREALQSMILERIESKEIVDQASLDAFIATVTMATDALKMVPYNAYRTMVSRKA